MSTKKTTGPSVSNSTDKSIVKGIEDSRKQVTVLFTDIESSTRLWDTMGDTQGRVLVDRHNRLLFPVVRKFKGRVIKTIGDSIMASFKSPDNAVKAAIAMQQMLEKERKESKFPIKIRIGIHTGDGLVESDDVFGDVVNVAARVEAEALGNQILISSNTAELIDHAQYHLLKAGSFKPRGKKKVTRLFQSDWKNADSLIKNIRHTDLSMVMQKQRVEIAVYTAIALCFFIVLYQNYLKYITADSENASLWMLNPLKIPQENPSLGAFLGFIALMVAIHLYRLRFISLKIVRFFKGLSTATLVWIAYLFMIDFSGIQLDQRWNEALYESKHLFVEVLEDKAPIRNRPSESADTIQTAVKGDLLLLNDITQAENITWNRVLVASETYGWIERKVPPKMGVAERRVTFTDKFYFRYKDLYGFLLMLPFFLWGFLNFRLKPI